MSDMAVDPVTATTLTEAQIEIVRVAFSEPTVAAHGFSKFACESCARARSGWNTARSYVAFLYNCMQPSGVLDLAAWEMTAQSTNEQCRSFLEPVQLSSMWIELKSDRVWLMLGRDGEHLVLSYSSAQAMEMRVSSRHTLYDEYSIVPITEAMRQSWSTLCEVPKEIAERLTDDHDDDLVASVFSAAVESIGGSHGIEAIMTSRKK